MTFWTSGSQPETTVAESSVSSSSLRRLIEDHGLSIEFIFPEGFGLSIEFIFPVVYTNKPGGRLKI